MLASWLLGAKRSIVSACKYMQILGSRQLEPKSKREADKSRNKEATTIDN